MQDISKTGYWNGKTAYIHHVHCKELSDWICNFLNTEKDKLIYDFGCGLGNYLKDLQENGFTKLIGIEGNIPKNKVFDLILEWDLTIPMKKNDENLKGNVISLEVGEHIPFEYMHIYLDNITNFCNNYLIVSWAIQNQLGFGHVNCLNNEEIIPEFEKRGFILLKTETENARSIITNNAEWFKNTIMIFKKKQINK